MTAADAPAAAEVTEVDRLRAELARTEASRQQIAQLLDQTAAVLADERAERLTEAGRLRAQLDAIHALHTDSPAGVCPSCYRLADASDTDDGLVDWPCPTLRAMGVQDIAPPATARIRATPAGPTDRQLLVAVHRWAIANGWRRHRSAGWINAPVMADATLSVDWSDDFDQVTVGRRREVPWGWNTSDHPVASARQAVDVLVALDVLPARFSSAYRAALAPAVPDSEAPECPMHIEPQPDDCAPCREAAPAADR